MDPQQKAYATQLMGFLAWLDIFERVDTLMLEIRHVQETIASQLSVPTFEQSGIPDSATILYAPFRFEDHYLWGRLTSAHFTWSEDRHSSDWSHVLREAKSLISPISHGCSVLAALWCPEFPAARFLVGRDEPVFYETLKDERKKYSPWFDEQGHDELVHNLRWTRSLISTLNRFSANDDRLYDALRHLQLIKRDILRDKLVLAYRALEAFDSSNLNPPTSIARFLVVRRAALHSVNLRLEAFRDILATVQEILNLSIEHDPQPTVRRRRDQGIYTTDLADNCQHIAREINDFFATCADANDSPEGRRIWDNEFAFIVHRYTRQYTSTYRYDSIWNNSLAGETVRPNIAAGFVQSSFWMPERPDLQSIIAHEVAHLLFKRHYGNLEPFALDKMSDPLGRLLRQISYVLEANAPRFRFLDFAPRIREQFLRELACDLVAVAVHGTAYVFALYLELICYGSERLFLASRDGDIAANVSLLGNEYVTFVRDLRPEWLTRLTIALAFSNTLRREDDARSDCLETILHEGIEGVLNAVRHEQGDWMDGDQREDWDIWSEMTCVLRGLVEKATVAARVSKWRHTRAQQEPKGMAPFNRYVTSLPVHIVKGCLGAWLDRLLERPRMLGAYLDFERPKPKPIAYCHVIEAFRTLYLDTPSAKVFLQPPEDRLFNHLIDIPWQTAVLSAHDFLGDQRSAYGNHAVRPSRWITGIHAFNWLGRDLYHTALEYVVWYERPAIGRLKAMNRWLLSIDRVIDGLNLSGPLRAYLTSIKNLIWRILGDDLGKRPDTAVKEELFNKHVQEFGAYLLRFYAGPPNPEFKWSDRYAIANGAIRIGSQLICRFHPEFEQRINLGPYRDRSDAARSFDWIATVQMNFAYEIITNELDQMFSKMKVSDPAIFQRLGNALERPYPGAADTIQPDDLHCGQVIVELIRVAHYLDIRPERRPGERATRHHIDRGNDGWGAVFAQYLDVPIHARKLESEHEVPKGKYEVPNYIENLTPTRSVRVDRISQAYEATPEKIAHRPQENIDEGVSLFWIPWDSKGVRPNVKPDVRYSETLLSAPLLGRFDRLTLDAAKHTARISPYKPHVRYFRREQIGVPFAAELQSGGRVSWARSHGTLPIILQTYELEPVRKNLPIPLASISILLVQRSARLTFVERLLTENLVFKSFTDNVLLSPYRHFDPCRDIGLLTDGWGDIFLALFTDPQDSKANTFEEYATECYDLTKLRFDQIITLRKSIFEDTLVVRSETSYTPLAIDLALLNPDEYRCTFSIRFRATRDGASLSDEFERHLNEIIDNHALSELLSYSGVSGRTDYVITTKPVADREAPIRIYKELYRQLGGSEIYKGVYGIIFESLRKLIFKKGLVEDHVESTATAIAELKCLKY